MMEILSNGVKIENEASATSTPPLTQVEAMSAEADDHESGTGGSSEPTKRSERKRQREKQRRFDLSNAFDELAAFIAQVEPEFGEADLETKKKRKKSDGEDSSGVTRLDLIGRALQIMRRLHRENEERKRVIASMHDRGGPNENVMVMVPTLAPVGEETYPVARATYPSSAVPPRHPPNFYQSPHVGQHLAGQAGAHPTTHPSSHSATEYPLPVPGTRIHSPYQSTWNRYGVAPPHYHHPTSSGQAGHGMVPMHTNTRGPPRPPGPGSQEGPPTNERRPI